MISYKFQINLLFFSQLIIISCLEMSAPYWSLILQNLHPEFSAQKIQYWSAAFYIIPLLLTIMTTPLWSQLGDKIGHKKMLLRATGALIITQVLVGFVTDPIFIFIIRLMQGVFAGFTAAAQSWVIVMSHSKTHSYVLGRMQASAAVGTVAGPLLGGLIAGYFGYSAIFTISAVLCGFVLIAFIFYLRETPKRDLVKEIIKVETKLMQNKNVVYLLSIICFVQAAKWMSTPFFALYVIQQLGGTSLSVGILYSIIALAIFLSSSKWGALIDKKIQQPHFIKRIFITALLFSAMSQYLLAYASTLRVALFSCLLWGVCLGAVSLIPPSLLIKSVAEHSKSKIIGLSSSANKLGCLVGVAFGAIMQSETDFTHSFIASGILYGILMSILLIADVYSQAKFMRPAIKNSAD